MDRLSSSRARVRALSLLAAVLCAGGLGACGGQSSVTAATVSPPLPASADRLPPIQGDNATFDQDPVTAAAQIARYWSGYQRASGDMFDPIYKRGGIRYSQAEWAYTAIHIAAATGDAGLATFGLKAANWVAEHPKVQKTSPSSFEDAAMAGVLTDLPRLPASPLRDEVEPRVRAWLAQYRPALLFDAKYHTNKSLVEAVAVLEAQAAGVTLRHDALYRERALGVIGTSMPRVALKYTTRTSLGQTTVLSDPPKNPISYHALTLGYLARATHVLGAKTPLATRRLLVHMARGLVFLTAPDGAYAQWGRSQGQAWASAFGAYGLRVAAQYATAREQGTFERTATLLLQRMQRDDHKGPYGIYYVPAFADLDEPYVEPRGVDPYANAVTYVALALKALTWQLDVPKPKPVTTPQTSIDGVVRLNPGTNGESIVVRKPGLWFGVRPAGMLDGNHGYDLRYDFGLYAAEAKDAAGAWVDVMRPRPETDGTSVDSAGPVLITAEGERGYPTTEQVQTYPNGRIVLSVAWRGGTQVLGRGNVVVVPEAHGVREAVLAPAGSRVEFSIFAHRPKIAGRTVRDGDALAQAGPGARLTVDHTRYGSAYDRVQRRIRATFPVGAPGWVAYRAAS